MNKTIIEPEKMERLRQLAGLLQMEIRGQRHIIPRVVSVLQRGELGLSKSGRPRGSFLFLGPTGVGKTELTQVFTNRLFGMEKLIRYDMSEFQTQERAVKLGVVPVHFCKCQNFFCNFARRLIGLNWRDFQRFWHIHAWICHIEIHAAARVCGQVME